MSRALLVRGSFVLAVAASALSGCVSYYTETPKFQALPPPAEQGVVYVMRPTSQFGMLQSITAKLDDERWFNLFPGSYGAFYVKPGKVKLRVSIDVWASVGVFALGPVTMVTSGVETDAQGVELEIDVPPGGAVYVDTSVAGFKEPPDAEVVAESSGKRTAKSLHLAAGGKPRLPRAASALAKEAPPPPAPPPTPKAPTAQELVAELGRAVAEVTRACTPNPKLEGTCTVSTEEAKRALAAARAATERVRTASLPPAAESAHRSFSSMLQAIEDDRTAGRPVTLSKLGALSKTMKELETAVK